MRKIGLYLQGALMNSYPDTPSGQAEALEDLRFAVRETGVFHELKYVEDKEVERGG